MKGRTEVKRVIKKSDLAAVKGILCQAGFMPHKNYQVMSLYFDDSDFSLFYDHTNGANYRYKYRLRAYRDGQGKLQENMFFEKKIKKGSTGTKERFEIKDAFKKIDSEVQDDLKILCQVAAGLQRPGKFSTYPSGLEPCAFISYHRQRYTNLKLTTEFTIDTNINAAGVSKLNSRIRSVQADFFVVEEKCEQLQNSSRDLKERLNQKAYPNAFSKYIWMLQRTLQYTT